METQNVVDHTENKRLAAECAERVARTLRGEVDLTKSRRETPPTLDEQTEAWRYIAKRDRNLLDALAEHDQAPREVLVAEIKRLRAVIKRAETQIDVILRGQHTGWSATMAYLRETLRSVR